MYLQSGNDCFLLACCNDHEVIVRELLAKDKVNQNVVNNVRNCPVLCLFVRCAIVCVPHLQSSHVQTHVHTGLYGQSTYTCTYVVLY